MSFHFNYFRFHRLILITVMVILSSPERASAQDKKQKIRVAKIVVDSAQLKAYHEALKEGIETALRVESGVQMLYAVYDKVHPTHITVFEIYANEEAYQIHITTPHFKKYKDTVKDMVKSLELTDVLPIALGKKPLKSKH